MQLHSMCSQTAMEYCAVNINTQSILGETQGLFYMEIKELESYGGGTTFLKRTNEYRIIHTKKQNNVTKLL